MNVLSRALPLLLIGLSTATWAEPTATTPSAAPATAPAPAAKPAAAATPAAAPASAAKPLTATAPAGTATPATPVAPPAPVITPEQRHQQELLANAEKIDHANRDLLAKNQELQLQNENLGIQVNVLQKDRSAEGIRNGAIAVIAGFFIGFFFSGTGGRRNKSGW